MPRWLWISLTGIAVGAGAWYVLGLCRSGGFVVDTVDVGRVYVESGVVANFPYINRTGQPRRLDVRACCGMRAAVLGSDEVPPGGKATVQIRYIGPPGIIDRQVYVIVGRETYVLRLFAQVVAGVRIQPSEVVYEVDPENREGVPVQWEVVSDDGIPFAIRAVTSSSRQLIVDPVKNLSQDVRHRLTGRIYGGEGSANRASMRLSTSHPKASERAASVIITNLEDILVEPSAACVTSRTPHVECKIWSRSGRKFEVSVRSRSDCLSVRLDSGDGTSHKLAVACEPSAIKAGQIGDIVLDVAGKPRRVTIIGLDPWQRGIVRPTKGVETRAVATGRSGQEKGIVGDAHAVGDQAQR